MSFGKRVTSSGARQSESFSLATEREQSLQSGSLSESQQREALVAELRAMARARPAEAQVYHGSVSGRPVNEHGPNANPVLADREGVASAGDVRRADYYASSALGNLSAIIGVVGGVALGFSAQSTLGFTFVVWGLTAVATGRMMQGKAFFERIYMGRAARLAGLGVVLTGAWLLYQGWSAPSVLGYFSPELASSVRGIVSPNK